MRNRIAALCLLLGLALCAGGSHADEWPQRPVKFVVGFAPGGANDIITRLLAQGLTDRMKMQFIVENRAGSGGSIGAAFAAAAAPDGHTLVLSATAPLAINPNLYAKLAYDPRKDFAPRADFAPRKPAAGKPAAFAKPGNGGKVFVPRDAKKRPARSAS